MLHFVTLVMLALRGTGSATQIPTPSPAPPSKAPDQVTITSVSPFASSQPPALRVSWSKLNKESKVPISSYLVEYQTNSSGASEGWQHKIVKGTVNSTILVGLAGETPYLVRVQSQAGVVTGPYSRVKKERTYRAPGQVFIRTISPAVFYESPALTVRWSEPSRDPRLPISGYHIDYTDTSKSSNPSQIWKRRTVGGTTTSTTINGLFEGTEYRVRVRAISSVGPGPFSNVLQERTYRVPGQVNIISVSPAESSQPAALSVSWSEPSKDPRLPITSYYVEYKTTSSSESTTWQHKIIGGISNITKLDGLREETKYRIRVRAVSNVGTGPLSNEVRWRTNAVPGWNSAKRTNHSLTPSPQAQINIISVSPTMSSHPLALRVRWNVSSSELGLSIIVYHIEYWTNSSDPNDKWQRKTVGGATSTTALYGLSEGTLYRVRVRAVAEDGTELFSNEVDERTYTAPGQVKISSVIPEVSYQSSALIVKWSEPSRDPRLPISGYHVEYKANSSGLRDQWQRRTITKRTITTLGGLCEGVEYEVRVRAVSPIGTVPYSSVTRETTYRVPGQVSIITVSPAESSQPAALSVNWREPSRDPRLAISTYCVEFQVTSSGPSGKWQYKIVGGITTRATIEGLSRGTEYRIRVRAVSKVGAGQFSNVVRGRTFAVPGPVSSLNYTITSDTEARIMWGVPEEPNGVIRGYDVMYGVYGANDGQAKWAGTALSINAVNLHPETPIQVTVRAYKSASISGMGAASTLVFFTKEGIPTVKPKMVNIYWVSCSQMNVSWTPLSLFEARGWPVYTVHLERLPQRSSGYEQSVNTTESSVVISNLDSTHSYSIHIQVGTGAGTNHALRSDQEIILGTKEYMNTDTKGTSGLIAGIFMAGLVSGIIATLLVVGIACGLYKVAKLSIQRNTHNPDIEMTDCPAYESYDKAYENIDKPMMIPK